MCVCDICVERLGLASPYINLFFFLYSLSSQIIFSDKSIFYCCGFNRRGQNMTLMALWSHTQHIHEAQSFSSNLMDNNVWINRAQTRIHINLQETHTMCLKKSGIYSLWKKNVQFSKKFVTNQFLIFKFRKGLILDDWKVRILIIS